MTKTLDDALTEIKAAGYKLNNLFQRSDGQWMGNLRCLNGFFYEYGIEDTPVEVLQTALINAQNHVGMFKNGPGGRPDSTKFSHQIGDKVPGWDTYPHATKQATLDNPLAIPPYLARNKFNERRTPAVVVDENNLLGADDEGEAAGAVSEVDDLLG